MNSALERIHTARMTATVQESKVKLQRASFIRSACQELQTLIVLFLSVIELFTSKRCLFPFSGTDDAEFKFV